MQILWGSTILWLNPYFYLILAIKAIFDCFCNCKSTWITLLCVSKQGVIQKRTNFKIEHGTGFCYDFMLGLVTREVYITYLMILQITLINILCIDIRNSRLLFDSKRSDKNFTPRWARTHNLLVSNLPLCPLGDNHRDAEKAKLFQIQTTGVLNFRFEVAQKD